MNQEGTKVRSEMYESVERYKERTNVRIYESTAADLGEESRVVVAGLNIVEGALGGSKLRRLHRSPHRLGDPVDTS